MEEREERQATKGEQGKRQKRYKALLPIGHLSADISAGCLTGVLPFLIAANHYSYATATVLVMISNIIGSVAQIIFGEVADRKNQPLVMLAGILLSCGGMALVGALDSYVGMCIAVSISGIGIAMFHPQAMKILNAFTTDKEMGMDVGLFSLGGSLGVTLGPLVITAFVKLFGMKGCLLLFAIPAVYIAVCTTYGKSLLRTEKGDGQSVQKDQAVRTAQASDLVSDSDSVLVSDSVLGLTPVSDSEGTAEHAAAYEKLDEKKSVNRWDAFLILTIVVFGRSAAAGTMNTFVSLYWIDSLGQSDAAGNTALSVFSGIMALFTFLGGGISDRLGHQRTIRISSIILVPTIFLMAVTTNLVAAGFLLFPLGIGLGLSYSPLIVLGQIYLPERVGLASAVTMGLASSVGSVLTPVFGGIADSSGLGQAFYIMGFVSCIPLIASFFLKKSES